jgi:hypothetical protein
VDNRQGKKGSFVDEIINAGRIAEPVSHLPASFEEPR